MRGPSVASPSVTSPSVARGLAAALAWLFPAPCLGCGAALADPRAPLLLCPGCNARLRPQPASACPGCGRPLPAAAVAARCGACRELPPPWEALSAAFLYAPPLTGVVRALKFRGGEFLGPPLGEALAGRCPARGAEVVTAVPLPWPRLLARGYNQAEVVARSLAARLALPHRRLLVRRARRRQTGLARQERVRNVSGAFQARRGEPIRGARVLLVDDVMTTGATLEAAARALRRAGAAAVVAAVVARTPRADWGDPEAVPPRPWSGAP